MSDPFYATSDPQCLSLEQSLHENRDLATKLLEDVTKTEELLISLHKQLKKAKEFTSALDHQLLSRRAELNAQYKQLADQYGVPLEHLSVITLLSDELYLAILTYFDYSTLTEISTVSKKWLTLTRDNSLWLALFMKAKDKYVPESVREQDRKRRAAQEERQKGLTALSGLHKHKRRLTADKRGTELRPRLPCYYAHWHHYFADRMRVHSWVWPETAAPRSRREAVGFGAPEPGWALALEDCALSQLRHGRVELFDKLTVVLADVQHDLNKNSNILTTDGLNCDQHEQWADSLSLKAQTKTPFDAALLCERAVDKYLTAVQQFEDKYLAPGDSLEDTAHDSPVRLLTSKHDYRRLVDSLLNERELHAHVARYLTRVNINNVNINNTNQFSADMPPPKVFDFSTALTAVSEELSGTDTAHTSLDLTPVTSSSFDFTSSGEQLDSVNQLSLALKFNLKMESAPTSPATSGGSWKKKRVKQRRRSLGEWSTQPKPQSRTHDALTSPRATAQITAGKMTDKKSDLAVIRKHVILTFKLASTVIRLAELLATQFSTQSHSEEIGFVLALYHMAELLCTRLITVLHTDWLLTTWSRSDDTDTTASTSSSGSIGTSDEFRACLSGNNSPRSDPGDSAGVNMSLGKAGPLDFQQESYCFYCGIRKNQYFSLKVIATLALLHERRAKLLQQLLKEEAQSHVTTVNSPRQHSPRSRSAHNSPLSSPRVTGVAVAGRSRQLSFLLTVLRQYETFAALRSYLHIEYDAARLVSEYLGAVSEERVHELSGRELNHATFCLQQITALDVADHQALFELARIYAVMVRSGCDCNTHAGTNLATQGNEGECEKVLARCATGDKCSGPLDLDDFDKYRHTAWFRHVVQVQRPTTSERLDHVTLNLPGLPEEPTNAQNRKMFKAKKRVTPIGTIPESDGKPESEPK